MTLTIRYHVQQQIDTSKWKAINSEVPNVKYKVYEEAMSTSNRLKIILEIAWKTIVSFGMYYFIYLKCTKDGKADLENLRKRTFVHYVANDIPKEELKAGKVAQDSKIKPLHQVSAKEFVKHHQLIERNKLREDKQELNIEVVPLSHLFKTCMQQVHDFRKICLDLKEIIQKKRNYFLDHLHDKNAELTKAIEKFLNLSRDVQDNYHLISLLAPFLKEKDLSFLLKNAIEMTKNAQLDKKSIYHEKFEEFQIAYNSLASKSDWLISIKEEKALFDFTAQMLELGDYYSPSFIPLYNEMKGFFEECLQSMKVEIKVDQGLKNEIGDCFLQWKKMYNSLQENLAHDHSYGVYYSSSMHFKKELEAFGYDEEFQEAVTCNELNRSFISLFFSGKSQDVLKHMQTLLSDSANQEAVSKACQNKVNQAREKEEESLQKVAAAESQEAFQKLQKTFIDQPDYIDAIYAILELEVLLKVQDPDKLDTDFFNFMRTLKHSHFISKGSKAVCDKDFYYDFNPYFRTIDQKIVTMKSLVEITREI